MTQEHTPTPFEQAYGNVYFPCHICLVEAAPFHVYERDEVCLIDGKVTCTNCAQDTYPDETVTQIPSPAQVIASSQAEISRLREAAAKAVAVLTVFRTDGEIDMGKLNRACRDLEAALSEGK